MADYFYGFTSIMAGALDPYEVESYDLLSLLVECIQDEDNQ